MSERWRRLGGEVVYDAGIFRVRRDAYEHEGSPTHPFHVLEANSWINVVPVTAAGEIVLVRQYRHGIQEPTIEIPGGMVDGRDRDPAAAAVRELLEETGYAGAAPELMGTVSSNPAILTNRTHCFVVRDAKPVRAPAPDPHEDVTVELRPAEQVREMVLRGEIHHSLSACALLFYFLRGA